MDEDLYASLGVDPAATDLQIKSAYRRLLLAYHPDKAGSDDVGRFLAVQHAYSVLSSKERRQKYDQRRQLYSLEVGSARNKLKEQLDKSQSSAESGPFHSVVVDTHLRDRLLGEISHLVVSEGVAVVPEGDVVRLVFPTKRAYFSYRRMLADRTLKASEVEFFEFEREVLRKFDFPVTGYE